MKKMIILFFLILFLGGPVLAQESPSSSKTIETSKIEELIETLESDADRSEFVDNLKTLVEVDEEQNADKPAVKPLTQAIGLGDQAETIIGKYEAFLKKNNLKSSTVGKVTLSLISTIVLILFLLLARKVGLTFRDKLFSIQDKYLRPHNRFRYYARGFRYFAYAFIMVLFVYTIGLVWDISWLGFLISEGTISTFASVMSIVIVILLGIVIWESINGGIDYSLRATTGGDSMRLQTLLPIIKNVLFGVFAALFTMVILSELGIDIIPLLAGAGVLGIAIGFGAQSMVKDFLTGFTIIFEDLIQVGDVATLGGHTGIIEKITIRKVQLRALDGAVFTVPFSEISIVENKTKDFSMYLMDVGIAYREDPEEAIEVMKEIDAGMREEDKYKNLILAPIEILGVDQFADSAVIIKARMKTRPLKQWEIGREFNKRLKYKFDEHDIEIPFPHQTIYFGVDKEGKAPSAPIELKPENKPKKKKVTS